MRLLHRLKSSDVPWIQKLANEIWEEYYPKIIGNDQIKYMLDRFYSIESLQNDFDREILFYSILDPIKKGGFLSLEKIDQQSLFIHKFYIHQDCRNTGLGSKVFQELILDIFPKTKEIRLKVNRFNVDSINFYFKNGFKIESFGDFEIGNGYVMNDYIMLWRRN
jgi:RimJ/RimL family protein N-acetyltransferase